MSIPAEIILAIAGLLLMISVLVSKVSDRFGVPALLLFLLLGMLAGSDGPGGIYFDDPALTQFIGVIALGFILFSGGLGTDWQSIRPVLKQGVILGTLGVAVTALLIGLFAQWVLGISLLEGLLLGAIVSSTDAAAVMSVLRSKSISLKGQLKPLLELESGSNDPMAVFLTIGLIGILAQQIDSPMILLGQLVLQMALGALLGYGLGRTLIWIVNRVKLNYDGLYPVLTLAFVLLVYGVASVLGGNGFLAVYLSGIVVGNSDFIHKRSLLRFHDGLAWLMQIAMFLTLGLLVFPSQLFPVIGVGLLIVLWLMLVARPVAVFIGLIGSKMSAREKALISWVGLRGAVPIILATYPRVAGLPSAPLIFNIVFFVVLASVLLQGTSIPRVAHWLRVEAPLTPKRSFPLEYTPVKGLKSELRELVIPARSFAVGRAIVELHLPRDVLVILIGRGDEFLVSTGSTVLQGGDTLLILADQDQFRQVADSLTAPRVDVG
ncbi:K(+)/H(+) antiporter NhaP [Thermoflexales bacterium]|nr:K(+)/H(+) antiporter NhaP [Thermoflexales bacterium]